MATATFVATDTTTQGNWYCSGGVGPGTYGRLGYYKLLGSGPTLEQSLPSGVGPVSVSGATTFSWSLATDARGLLRADGSTRDADTWFSASSFTFAIPASDSTTRRLRVYCLDWDASGRVQTLAVYDHADTGHTSPLDSRSLSSFSGGVWLSWDVSGSVDLVLTKSSGLNSVASGIFWDTASGGTPAFLAAGPRLIQQAVKRASYF